MPTYQADAIVLHRLDYGDADRILTLLTREHGKLAAIAKGARRSKTRVGSSLDLFGRSRMMLAKGKNLDVVAQVERRGEVRNIARGVLRVLPGNQGERYARLRLPDPVIDEVEQAPEEQLEYHLDRRLKSLDYIRSGRH